MRVHRWLWLLVLLAAGSALARKKVVVVDAPLPLKKLIVASIKSRYTTVNARQSLSREPLTKEIQSIAGPQGAVAIVRGRIAGRTWQVQVFNAQDGSPLMTDMFKVKGKRRPRSLPRNTFFDLVGALAEARAVGTKKAEPVVAKVDPKVTPGPTVTPPTEKPPEVIVDVPRPSGPVGSDLPAMRTAFGFRGFNRAFGYFGEPSAALAVYNLPFATSVAIDADWFPGEYFTTGPLTHLGASVQADIGVGLASRQDQSRFGTRSDRVRLGAVYRFNFGNFVPFVHAGYSTQTFAIAPVAANDFAFKPNIPSVTFTGARGGAGARFTFLNRFTLDATFGAMYVAGKGEIGGSKFFPRTQANALDGAFGFSVRFAETLEVRVAGDWTKYFLTLNPEEGAALTARGASDQYLGGSLSVAWVM